MDNIQSIFNSYIILEELSIITEGFEFRGPFERDGYDNYEVDFENNGDIIPYEVSFDQVLDWLYELTFQSENTGTQGFDEFTNRGAAKLMYTIKDIINDYQKKNNKLQGISYSGKFSSSGKGSGESSRASTYEKALKQLSSTGRLGRLDKFIGLGDDITNPDDKSKVSNSSAYGLIYNSNEVDQKMIKEAFKIMNPLAAVKYNNKIQESYNDIKKRFLNKIK